MIGGQWINSLLGPAVVALAYPLYKRRRVLIKYMFPIIGGVLAGLFSGMVSGLLFAELFGISRSLILSIIPKSITTPVAIQIASGIGGVPSMTVVFVMIAGFSGVILGPSLLKWIRIRGLTRERNCIRERFPCARHLKSNGVRRINGLHELCFHDALRRVRVGLRPRRSMDVSNLKLTVLRQLFSCAAHLISFHYYVSFVKIMVK